jgi:hypothetical protein
MEALLTLRSSVSPAAHGGRDGMCDLPLGDTAGCGTQFRVAGVVTDVLGSRARTYVREVQPGPEQPASSGWPAASVGSPPPSKRMIATGPLPNRSDRQRRRLAPAREGEVPFTAEADVQEDPVSGIRDWARLAPTLGLTVRN